MYKYFTKYNTFRYLDVINKLLTGYNNSVHSTIGMPPSKVNFSNIYTVWQRINCLWGKIPQGGVKFKVGNLVRITKEKVKFAKVYEQTSPTDISGCQSFKAPTPICLRTLGLARSSYGRPVLQLRSCQGHCFTPEFGMDKIVRTHNKDGIKQHFVKWRGYDETFKSWVNSTDKKKI